MYVPPEAHHTHTLPRQRQHNRTNPSLDSTPATAHTPHPKPHTRPRHGPTRQTRTAATRYDGVRYARPYMRAFSARLFVCVCSCLCNNGLTTLRFPHKLHTCEHSDTVELRVLCHRGWVLAHTRAHLCVVRCSGAMCGSRSELKKYNK